MRGWRETLAARPAGRLGGRSVLAVLLVLAAAASFAATAGGASAPSALKDPNAIACPTAPSGWTNPPVLKSVATPESVPEPDAEEHFATGGNLVSVSCTYHESLAQQVLVVVAYALPSDINPVNDFYWGCGTGDTPWNDSDRIYRIPSDTQWASATLVDFDSQLTPKDLPPFEAITRQLLQNANGYAHSCGTVSKPTDLTSRYSFDVRIAGGNLKSVFWTSEATGSAKVSPVVQATVTRAALKVKASGNLHPLTIQLTRGLDYRPTPTHTADTVRYSVTVMSSQVPACHRGATGTLTISTKPSVLLDVCGQTFLRGEAPRRIRFFP